MTHQVQLRRQRKNRLQQLKQHQRLLRQRQLKQQQRVLHQQHLRQPPREQQVPPGIHPPRRLSMMNPGIVTLRATVGGKVPQLVWKLFSRLSVISWFDN